MGKLQICRFKNIFPLLWLLCGFYVVSCSTFNFTKHFFYLIFLFINLRLVF